jgi:colanic acid/amylovoran biosynthesis glycosyltransferase
VAGHHRQPRQGEGILTASQPPARRRVVAYLVNVYPAPSHSFIRREIQALERRGIEVRRFSTRPPRVPSQVIVDRGELERTTVILPTGFAGILRLIAATFRALLRWPLGTSAALALAIKEGLYSDRGVTAHLAYWAEACSLARHLQDGVVHLHAHFGTNSASVAMLAAVITRLPYSFTVHGPAEFDRATVIGLPAKAAHAVAVVAISNYCRSQVMRFCASADHAKIVVVRCGLDAAFLSAPPAPMPHGRDLLFVGRLHVDKGLPTLLAACRILRERGTPFHLRLIGGGEDHAELQRAIEAGGLQGQVELLGWCDEGVVLRHLDNSIALVLPSFAEGLPVVLMEALARGRPVVTTRITGIPELVQHGTNGWLVTPGDATELANAMTAALAMTEPEWLAMGANGRNAVQALHSVDESARQLEQLFLAPTGRQAS